MPIQGMPTSEDFDRGRVTNPQQSEVIRKRYYDYLLYAAAGQLQLSFFSQALGQGFATALGSVAGTPKTLADTNLELPKTLPSGREFLAESIEVMFWPGSVSTANTYTPAALTAFAAAAAVTVPASANDCNVFLQSGTLSLNVLSKPYMQETPMQSFAPKTWIGLDAAVASNSATVGEVAITAVRAMGRPYYLEPPITLQPTVNFDIAMQWPGLVAMPSTFNARVGVVMDGYEMRASQ